jgi:hypothetical protein
MQLTAPEPNSVRPAIDCSDGSPCASSEVRGDPLPTRQRGSVLSRPSVRRQMPWRATVDRAWPLSAGKSSATAS